MATEENSNNGSNPSAGGTSDLESLLKQSPWGRLINEVTSAGDIFRGFVSATGGGGEGSGPPAGAGIGGGGNPFTNFGNPNASGSPLTGGVNPWAAIGTGGASAPSGSGTTGAPTGGFGGFGGGTTGAPTGGFGGFGGGTTGAPTSGFPGTTGGTTGSYSDAFGGATSEVEVRMYIDNLVNTNLRQGGIAPSFNVPSGEGTIPENIGNEGFSEDIFLSIFGIPSEGSFDLTSYNIPSDQTGDFASIFGGGIPSGSGFGGDGIPTDAINAQISQLNSNFEQFASVGAQFTASGNQEPSFETVLQVLPANVRETIEQYQNNFGPFIDAISNGENPFASGSNPFASGSNPFASGGNPFAGGGNPFAGGGNPFTGGGNPFAGGGNPFAGGGNPFAGSSGA